jgi:hypothetical protein
VKVRSVTELSELIREDLAWRRKEIVAFHSLVLSAKPGARDALLRGAVAVLYAHWEGFVKGSARRYLSYVKFRKLSLGHLADCFVGLAARSHLHSLNVSGKAALHAALIKWLLDEWPKRAHLPAETVIDARSNLTVEVFQNILAAVGIPYRSEYAVREKPVIEKLVDMRNDLAHGEWRPVDVAAYEALHTQTDLLMSMLCGDIEAAAQNEIFRRTPTTAVAVVTTFGAET